METLEKLLELISKNGLALVISAGVLIFAVKFGNIGIDYLKEKIGVKKHDELAALRMQVSKTIQALLDRNVLRTRACRAYVFEYHNGTISLGGLPFLKTSCVYEALGEGVKSEALARKDLSLQLYNIIYDSLNRYPYIVLDVNNRNYDMDSALGYETLAKRGVSVSVRVKITDLNRRVIGFVGVDYSDPVDDRTLQDAIDIMQDAAVEIGALLSVKK